MDLKLIQKLVALMERGKLAELEVEDKESGLKVRLKSESAVRQSAAAAPVVHMLHGGAPAMASAPAPTALGGGEIAKPAREGKTINSPMVGTFYRAASPEAEPFARSGTRIAPEQTLCIIEAMKVMNEIKAEISGEILEVLVENGEPVEFGQPLFLVKTD
jgi:acetyl-CoA carboxylase biotin carboxyl carrier protein